MSKTYHVTQDLGGRWVVRKTGSDRAEKAFPTQSDAIDFAKRKARVVSKTGRVEIVVHQRDGRIRSKDSYGSDPKPPVKRKR